MYSIRKESIVEIFMIPSYQKGFSLTELMVAMFLLSILSIGLIAFSQYLNGFRYTANLEIVNKSFNRISDVLKNKGCKSFIGLKANKKVSIYEITDNQDNILYISSKNPKFNITTSEHFLNRDMDAYIESMTLYPPNNRDTSIFEIIYKFGDGRELKKILKLEVFLDSESIIINCLHSYCKERHILPQYTTESHMGICYGILENDNNIIDNCIENNHNSQSTQVCIDNLEIEPTPLVFRTKQISSGETLRLVIQKRQEEGAPKQCMCLGLFTCYKGYLSELIKCFQTN